MIDMIEEPPRPHRRDAMALSQLIINLVGIFGNLIMIFVLWHRSMGGRLPTILFLSQAATDLCVNLHSFCFSIQPAMWRVHVLWLDAFICKTWHSLFTFWFCVQVSIGSLVLIGLERYFALVHPMLYQRFQSRRLAAFLISGNSIYNFFLAIPNIYETTTDINGTCVSQNYDAATTTLLKVYSIVWFIFIYTLALVLLIFFYTGVILSLRKSAQLTPVPVSLVSIISLNREGNLAESTGAVTIKRSQVTMQFTRMAIVITLVYLICITYDAFSYLLGRTGVTRYDYNTLPHQLGMLAVSVNSCANPIIYFGFVVKASFVRWLVGLRQRRKSMDKKIPMPRRYRRTNASLLIPSFSESVCYLKQNPE
ncbi:unnamed protein product [Protopolystoma xenopodis]|uniref:G-protein coupled receptors family 1 profile domain-containing protein n=1 Tax=Protopolystoma xenopodis TaxID=117903 RepID=A0A3S5AJR3_9PLAT|nr:unnamed protein product [Protopolystoma xenopodis]